MILLNQLHSCHYNIGIHNISRSDNNSCLYISSFNISCSNNNSSSFDNSSFNNSYGNNNSCCNNNCCRNNNSSFNNNYWNNSCSNNNRSDERGFCLLCKLINLFLPGSIFCCVMNFYSCNS